MTRPGRLLRLSAWSIALLVFLPLTAGIAGAVSPPAVEGKVVAPGAFGIPYGQGPNPPVVPFAPPATATFSDGDLVYDVQVSIEVVNANPYAVSLPVSAEEYTSGTATHLVPIQEPNGTIVLEQETYPVREDPSWSNATLDVLPDSSASVSLPLAQDSSSRPLSVTVGSATWSLSVLTPATSSLSGLYSVGGVNAVVSAGEGAGFLAAVVVFGAAWGLTRKVYRTPRVTPWYPFAWIFAFGVPYYGAYVPLNQTLGFAAPYLLPFVVGAVAFPYACRVFRRSTLSAALGLHALNARESAVVGGVLELIDDRLPFRVAPRSWREVAYVVFGAPLRRVIGFERRVLGETVEVSPTGLPVRLAPGLSDYHRLEEKRVYWYDARYEVEDVPTRLRLRREETVEVPAEADPSEKPRTVTKRRWGPHLEIGHVKSVWIPTLPVMEHLAKLRAVEGDATEGEVARLRLLSALGAVGKREAEAEYKGGREVLDALAQLTEPRTEEEIRSSLERMRSKHEGRTQAKTNGKAEG